MNLKSIESVRKDVMKVVLLLSIMGSIITAIYLFISKGIYVAVFIQLFNIILMTLAIIWLENSNNTSKTVKLILTYLLLYLYIGLWASLGFFHYMAMLYGLMIIMSTILTLDNKEMHISLRSRMMIVATSMIIDFLNLRSIKTDISFGELLGVLLGFGLVIYLTYAFKRTIRNIVQELLTYSFSDPLTHAKNFRAFMDDLEHAKADWGRYHKNFTVITFDLNAFKAINDLYGHQVGNDVLIEVVTHINSVLRTGDAIYRTGGDEFVIILNNCDKSKAINFIKRLPTHHQLDLDLNISLSFGIADASETYHEIVELTDQRMYSIKNDYEGNIHTVFTHDGGIKVFQPNILAK